MASVQGRGRRNRIPYSHYAPIRVTDDKPLYKVLASDAVPQGLSGVTKNQQIGYWNEQVRWRMRRGEKVELPSNWHFYYLGTGPHSEVPFRKRTEGVYWVALAGSKTEPTNLGERKPSVKPLEPDFKTRLPSNVEVVEPTTPQSSRANSRSRSRGPQSRNSSNSTSDSQSRNNNKNDQPRNQSSRPQSRNRNQSSNRNQSNDKDASSKEDLIAAVAEALKSLGIGQKPNQPKQQPRPQVRFNNKNKSKSRSNSASRDQKDKPEWRRTPTGEDTVEACFGSRGGFRNFGDSEMLQKGVQASGYAQIAGLVPSSPALLFGGNVAVKELADDVEITYTYKMTVPKDDPNLALFLAQVDAYKNGSARPQRVKKQRRAKSPAPPTQTDGMLAQDGEEPIYDDVASVHTHDSGEDTQFEMVNEVFAHDTSSSTA